MFDGDHDRTLLTDCQIDSNYTQTMLISDTSIYMYMYTLSLFLLVQITQTRWFFEKVTLADFGLGLGVGEKENVRAFWICIKVGFNHDDRLLIYRRFVHQQPVCIVCIPSTDPHTSTELVWHEHVHLALLLWTTSFISSFSLQPLSLELALRTTRQCEHYFSIVVSRFCNRC